MTPGPDEGRRTMDLFDMPESSPWGPVQNCKVLCPGAFQVDTASHGGVMINCEIIDLTLSKAAQKCGFHEGGYLCFEEDCAATVALRELMDKKLFTAPVNDYFKPGEYSKIIDQDGKPISDSKRYSMLGNSIAVPCAAYIMQGIRQIL